MGDKERGKFLRVLRVRPGVKTDFKEMRLAPGQRLDCGGVQSTSSGSDGHDQEAT